MKQARRLDALRDATNRIGALRFIVSKPA